MTLKYLREIEFLSQYSSLNNSRLEYRNPCMYWNSTTRNLGEKVINHPTEGVTYSGRHKN